MPFAVRTQQLRLTAVIFADAEGPRVAVAFVFACPAFDDEVNRHEHILGPAYVTAAGSRSHCRGFSFPRKLNMRCSDFRVSAYPQRPSVSSVPRHRRATPLTRAPPLLHS